MKQPGMNRRDFTKLAASAFGGVVAGTVVGCSKKTKTGKTSDDAGKTGNGEPAKGKEGDLAKVPNPWTGKEHICRQLNDCKGQGKGGENACRGQGECATVATHTCGGDNTCKYLGGCKESVGANACKGLGECAVKLGEKSWKKARKAFLAAMEKAGTPIKKAPPKKKTS